MSSTAVHTHHVGSILVDSAPKNFGTEFIDVGLAFGSFTAVERGCDGDGDVEAFVWSVAVSRTTGFNPGTQSLSRIGKLTIDERNVIVVQIVGTRQGEFS